MSNRALLGQVFVMEWSNPTSEVWSAAHEKGGVLAKEPAAWKELGASWLLVHPCPTIDGQDPDKSFGVKMRAKLKDACPTGEVFHDHGHRLTDWIGATAVPEIYIVDARGELIHTIIGTGSRFGEAVGS